MKNKKIFILVLLILGTVSDVGSQENEDSNEITCPTYVTTGTFDPRTNEPKFDLIYANETGEKISVSQVSKCQNESFEVTMNKLFLLERERFNLRATEIYKDNQNPPEYLAQISVQSLRESAVCQQIICDHILTECPGDTGLTLSDSFGRAATCAAMQRVFFSVARDEISAILQANAAKKSLSLQREKTRWWETSFDQYVIKNLVALNRVLKVIEEKLSNFLRAPV